MDTLDITNRYRTNRDDPDLRAVDAREFGSILGLSVRTVRRLDQTGKIPRPIKIGGAVRWRLDEIKNWLASGCPDRKNWEARPS